VQVTVYALEPRGAFHFGERGVGLEVTSETFRSDSLFSALCAVIRDYYGPAQLDALLAACLAGSPPFRLSSCFPRAGSVRFFPRPLLPLPASPPPDAAKRLKRTRYISQGLLWRWLAGEDLSGELAPGNFLEASGAWLSAAERATLEPLLAAGATALWARDEAPRVAVDRRTNASAIWRCGRLLFQPDCGLYFLASWEAPDWRSIVETALAVLGDAGLGGRRSQGHGQFTVAPPAVLELPEPAAPDTWLTLALYWPTPAELAAGALAAPAQFELVMRQGWAASPATGGVRRREVRMVAEGSLLARRPEGALADVTPEGFTAHRIYRAGLAFPLGVRLGGSDA
jgi:CRISPR-associated protein Csm4